MTTIHRPRFLAMAGVAVLLGSVLTAGAATAHGPVKALILDLDAKKAEAVMMPLLDAPSGSVSIRTAVSFGRVTRAETV